MDLSIVWVVVILVFILASMFLGSSVKQRNRTSTAQTPKVTNSPISTPKSKTVSKGQAECRRVLERIYGVSFDSVRPACLQNPETGRNLELDCFAEIPAHRLGLRIDGKIGIGCEYQGRQHYVATPMFQKDGNAFATQQWNDAFKKQMCEAIGIHLIIVPYTVRLNEIYGFILSKLKDLSILPI